MGSIVERQAGLARTGSIKKLSDDPRLRERTRIGIGRVSEACERIVESKGRLSISNVARALAEFRPSDHLAEQSIRNNSASGKAYRQVIAAWRLYAEAVAVPKIASQRSTVAEDFSDSLLQSIEPKAARIGVLSIRTELRNLRRQFQILQSVSPEKLIRGGNGEIQKDTVPPAAKLSAAEREALECLLDDTELASRGCKWDKMGRLMVDSAKPLSRPSLKSALQKALSTL